MASTPPGMHNAHVHFVDVLALLSSPFICFPISLSIADTAQCVLHATDDEPVTVGVNNKLRSQTCGSVMVKSKTEKRFAI